MCDDAKDFEEAAKKALIECMPKLIAEGPVGSQVHLALIAREEDKTYRKSADETVEKPVQTDPPKTEKKAVTRKSANGSDQIKKPARREIVRLYSTIEIPGLIRDNGDDQSWDEPAGITFMPMLRHHMKETRGYESEQAMPEQMTKRAHRRLQNMQLGDVMTTLGGF